jgi:hypothetical protein
LFVRLVDARRPAGRSTLHIPHQQAPHTRRVSLRGHVPSRPALFARFGAPLVSTFRRYVLVLRSMFFFLRNRMSRACLLIYLFAPPCLCTVRQLQWRPHTLRDARADESVELLLPPRNCADALEMDGCVL